MRYTNGEFTGTHKECCKYLNASLPRQYPENWPGGPWEEVDTTVELTLDQRRERKRQQLKMERTEIIQAPINGIQVATAEDRENIAGAVEDWSTLYGQLETIPWVLVDNTTRSVSREDLEEVIAAYKIRKRDSFAIYAGLLDQLYESDDPESVEWPELYE